jgi:hypothetical protein
LAPIGRGHVSGLSNQNASSAGAWP